MLGINTLLLSMLWKILRTQHLDFAPTPPPAPPLPSSLLTHPLFFFSFF